MTISHESLSLESASRVIESGLAVDYNVEPSGYERPRYLLEVGESTVQVSFYSPIEVPPNREGIYGVGAVIKRPNMVTFGHESVRRYGESGSDNALRAPSIDLSQDAELMVEANTTSILNVAAALSIASGNESPIYSTAEVQEAAFSIQHGKPTELAKLITDYLVAMRLCGEVVHSVTMNDFDPEYLMLKMLTTSDQVIANEIKITFDAAKKSLDDSRAETAEKPLPDLDMAAGEFGVRNIVLVHATSLRPVRLANGRWSLPTRQSSTETMYARNTLHFAMNGLVGGHLGGSWDEKGTLVVAPLRGMLEERGRPELVAAIDTAIDTEYNEDLTLPEGTIVIQPGLMSETDDLTRRENGAIVYRLHNYSGRQLQDIFGEDGMTAFAAVMKQFGVEEQQATDMWWSQLGTRDISKAVGRITGDKSERRIQQMIDARVAHRLRQMILTDYLETNGYPLFHQAQWGAGPLDEAVNMEYEALMKTMGFYPIGNHADFGGDNFTAIASTDIEGMKSTVFGGAATPNVPFGHVYSPEQVRARIEKLRMWWSGACVDDMGSKASEIIRDASARSLRVGYMLGLIGIVHHDRTSEVGRGVDTLDFDIGA